MRLYWPLLLLLLLLGSLGIIVGCGRREGGSSSSSVVGKKLSFTLPNLEGKQVKLSDYAGKPVVLNVFATWCAPCRSEMPRVQKEIWEPLGKQGVVVLGLNSMEDSQAVKEFVKQLGITFPVLVDEDGQVVDRLGDTGVPRTLLLDRDHKVTQVILGYNPEEFPKLVESVRQLAKPSK